MKKLTIILTIAALALMAIAASGGCDKYNVRDDSLSNGSDTRAENGRDSIPCSDTAWLWDISGINVYMEITDGEGNSLLDPETDGSLAGNGIKAIFRGETYVNDSTLLRHDFGYGTEQYGTKAYMPHFYGLVTYHYVAEDIYYLAFGELDGEEEFIDETLIIDWNDGSKQDTVTFSNRCTWVEDSIYGMAPQVERHFRLNGKETELPIKIVK